MSKFSALFFMLVLIGNSSGAYSMDFECEADGIIGFGIPEQLKFSDKETTRAAAEYLPVACGYLSSEKIVFCVKGPLAKDPNFLTMPDKKLSDYIRMDLQNEWAQSPEGQSFFAKFIDGEGQAASGTWISCTSSN